MTSGQSQEIDCEQVLLRVYEYLDGEVSVTESTTIRGHLEACAPCLRHYGLEEVVKVLIRRSHECDCAPVGLRERVLMTIRSSVSVELPQH